MTDKKIELIPLRDLKNHEPNKPETVPADDLPPIEFFATIHHDHYGPGEIEEINDKLLKASLERRHRHAQSGGTVEENKLTPAERKDLPHKVFAGPHDSFPIENDDHAHAAILDAIESYKAGHISAAEKNHIIARAHDFLNKH